jgi:hypothetical protein
MMKIHPAPLTCVALLLAAALACGFPTPGPVPTEAPPPTEAEPAPIETTPTSEPPAPTPEPPPEPRVVVHQGDSFNIFALDGSLIETRVAPGLASWPHPNQYQVVGNDIYYVDSGGDSLGGMVKRVTSAGVEELAFTAVADLANLTFAVSRDGTMIAWAGGEWGNSHLWVADINGGGSLQILQSDPSTGLEDFYVLEAYRWTAEGDLLFTWQISGIGNLLYFGYSSMYKYRPATGEIIALAEAPAGGGGPCWSIVSEGCVYLVGTCRLDPASPAGLREREISTGIETVLPLLPNQDQTGAAAYSPSGAKLAYAFARGGMDDVDGYIAVRHNVGEAPVVIATLPDGYYHKVQWVDEGRMVVEGAQAATTTVSLLALDGALTPISNGVLIGLMQP